MEPIEFVTVDSHKHIWSGPWALCRLIVRCQILLWSGTARIHHGTRGKLKTQSVQRSSSMSLEAHDRWDGWSWKRWMLGSQSLCFSRMKPWSGMWGGGGEGGEQGGGVGSKRGCEATGLKWDFHLFIYLAELIAQGCLLAFCCMFCGLSAPFPLLPPPSVFLMWVYLKVQICACVHTHLHLYYFCLYFFECVYVLALCERGFVSMLTVFMSVHENFITAITVCVFMHPLSCMKWEPELVSRDEWYLLG